MKPELLEGLIYRLVFAVYDDTDEGLFFVRMLGNLCQIFFLIFGSEEWFGINTDRELPFGSPAKRPIQLVLTVCLVNQYRMFDEGQVLGSRSRDEGAAVRVGKANSDRTG